MPIRIEFEMPYSLNVDGTFNVRAAGEEFSVHLSTHYRDNPQFPGAQSVENVAIVNDDTNILSYTKVVASYDPADAHAATDPREYSKAVAAIALSVANALITGVRLAYGDCVKDYLFLPKRLGPIMFTVPGLNGKKGFSGRFDPLQGGITIRMPPRQGPAVAEFARIVARGELPPISKDLYFDARRYLIHGNGRMALANLVISFETRLADALSSIATHRHEPSLAQEIQEATIGRLGTRFAKETLGHSFDEESYWGTNFTETYTWLREIRNKVLHRAQMFSSRHGVTRDFAKDDELRKLFSEHDWIQIEIENAVANVIAGRPAKP